jgi:hypothetical protein
MLGALRRGDVTAQLGADTVVALLGEATRPEAMRIAEAVRQALVQAAGSGATRRQARVGVLHLRGKQPIAALDAASARLRAVGPGDEIVDLDAAAAGGPRIAVAEVFLLDGHRHAGRAVRAPLPRRELAADDDDHRHRLQRTIASVVQSAASAVGDLWLEIPAAALSLLGDAAWRRIARPVPGMLRLVVATDELTPSRALVVRTRSLRLSGLGLVLASPDLGAASLEILATVRPDTVRFDFGVLRRKPAGPWSGRRTLLVAERLEARVLAHGLVDDADFDAARELGCHLGHGPLHA